VKLLLCLTNFITSHSTKMGTSEEMDTSGDLIVDKKRYDQVQPPFLVKAACHVFVDSNANKMKKMFQDFSGRFLNRLQSAIIAIIKVDPIEFATT
jgi:hypothetical protein